MLQKYNKTNVIKPKMFGEGDDENTNNDIDSKIKEFQTQLEQVKEINNKLVENNKKLVNEKREIETILEQEKKTKKVKDEEEMINSGKTKELLEVKTKEFQAFLAEKDTKISEYEKMLSDKENSIRKIKIETTLKSEIAKAAGFNPLATDDATNYAMQKFNSFDANGTPIILDQNGLVVTNKKGLPFSISDYVNEIRETKTFWFIQKAGSEFKQAGKSGLSRSEITAKLKDQNLTEAQRAELKLQYKNADF